MLGAVGADRSAALARVNVVIAELPEFRDLRVPPVAPERRLQGSLEENRLLIDALERYWSPALPPGSRRPMDWDSYLALHIQLTERWLATGRIDIGDPRLPADRERIAVGDPLGRLLELDELDTRPLCFDVAPTSGGFLATGCRDELPGAVFVETDSASASTIVCRERRLRASVHHAQFTAHVGGEGCEIGVVAAGYDASCGTASDTALGWGWTAEGCIRNAGTATIPMRRARYPWRAGDILGLRLDLTTGTLSAHQNGQRLGRIATGLPTAGIEFCWFATLVGAGTQMHIESLPPTDAAAEAKAEEIIAQRAAIRARIEAEAARLAREAAMAEMAEMAA